MLVLSRKRSEGIRVGDEIRIVVVKIERHGVRLGIEAPGHVSIIREELASEGDRNGKGRGISHPATPVDLVSSTVRCP